jgi:hypothetical protein
MKSWLQPLYAVRSRLDVPANRLESEPYQLERANMQWTVHELALHECVDRAKLDEGKA